MRETYRKVRGFAFAALAGLTLLTPAWAGAQGLVIDIEVDDGMPDVGTLKGEACGSDRLPEEPVLLGGLPFELNANGTSHIAWPFHEPGWVTVDGSVFHKGDDHFADDWNLGSGNYDLGKIALAAAPGRVIYAGRRPAGQAFAGYGNQVVVQVIDASGNTTNFAYRYAHLQSMAVQVGDYVHFGSEIGAVGGTGDGSDTAFSPHLHSVLYKNINQTAPGAARTGLANLQLGYSPSATLNGPNPSIFGSRFFNDAAHFVTHEEAQPCSTWNNNAAQCDAHSIRWGGRATQDCAYYACSGLCLPRGTSNCLAGCDQFCNANGDDSDESDPCHKWNNDLNACNAHRLQPGKTRDCAYYTTTNRCRPRGTANCLAGIESFCD